MSKVLLSFLGTGPKKDTTKFDKNDRQYREANYKFADGTVYSTPFIAEALAQYYDVDSMILIGTPHSMWEAVYDQFCKLRGVEMDEEYWLELYEYCQNADHNSPISIPHPEKIEQVLGPNSKIVLIHYGLDKAEMEENTGIIMQIEKYLNSNDELYIDITHSFRSLSLYIMNLLMYLKYVSKRNISITHVSYGMLDVMKEFNDFVPVVDMSGVMNVMEWVVGAYSFREFGNAYKISTLLKDEKPSVAQHLEDFSEYMNFNHLHAIRTEVEKFKALSSETYSALPQLVVEPVIKNFVKQFAKCSTSSSFQVQLARWQMEHHNYSSAYMSLSEAFVTYACELNDLDWKSRQNREDMKKWENLSPLGLFKAYNKVKDIRNGLAHQKEMDGRTLSNMHTVLRENIELLENKMK